MQDEEKDKVEVDEVDTDNEAGEKDGGELVDAKKHLEAIEKLIDAKVEAGLKKLDQPVKKNLNNNTSTLIVKEKEVAKEEKLRLWLHGHINKDFAPYLQAVQKDAMTTSNTSAVLPPTEFIAEVLRLEEQYGVARQFATLRRTDRRSITGIKGDADVSIFETAEAGEKQGTKVTYTPYTLTFRKFAAIAPITDELTEDSAVDIWNDLTARFARAYAQKEDQLVFTDSTSGILNATDAAEVTIVGDSIEDMTADDLNRMLYAVPTPSMANGRYYLNRTILGVIQRLKDSENRYIWAQGPNGPAEGTIWGRPYSLVEVLPALTADDAETGFVIYGDLKNTILAERTSLQAKVFDTGIVTDSDDEELNLLTQDAQALRVVKRFNSLNVFESAYSILKTGAATS